MIKKTNNKLITLIILDGWGYSESVENNAIQSAETPHFDELWARYPHTLLEASGLAVGLPAGQVGNSEIGHMTIGAGRKLDTDLVRIANSFDDSGFSDLSACMSLFDHIKQYDSVLHIMGLLGNGGVHAHHDHLVALLKLAKKHGIQKIAIHAFTDGRDTEPTSSKTFLEKLQAQVAEIGVGQIATLSGRYYSMDRDNNWDRLEKFESVLFNCQGGVCTINPSEYVSQKHSEGLSDEHLEPVVVLDSEGKTPSPLTVNDGIFIMNYRSDRAQMLTQKLLEHKSEKNLFIVTMTEYDKTYDVSVAFPPVVLETVLAAEISQAGLSQSHIAETEKFPHATYFLNGGRKEKHLHENHILLESRKDVATHDLAPKMRAEAIADSAIERILAGDDFLFVNIANPDMVGHSAQFSAIVEAIEETDKQMNRIVEATLQAGGIAIITADHGNAETNKDENGKPHTSHTLNKVPCIITDTNIIIKSDGDLTDLAPTVLEYLTIVKPESMTGVSLVSFQR